MISPKPIYLADYLKFERNKIPKNIKRLFYLSWEDALWDILIKKKIKKGSTVLVPEFFCGDVEDNIRNHGYKITYYPVNSRLTTSPKQLIRIIHKYSPEVLVILHPVGISNQLFRQNYWVKLLKPETILIEDSVHKIVDLNKIRFIKPNHFIIDSLRKVVPLQGSVVYAQKDDINFTEPSPFQSLRYATKVIFLWALMQIFWSLSHWANRSNVSNWLSLKANLFMKIGYDLIGDSILPARGFFVFNFLQQFIDFEKIRRIKRRQVEFYEKNIYATIPYLDFDKGEMMAYPLVLPINIAGKVLKQIRGRGLLLNFELNDSVWSKKHKIIYLPLGPHLSENNLKYITSCIS
ncbi:MAG: hypothetical protein WC744_02080 [Patescibacteria group bacterium]|jgi:hypothetical protein